MPRVLYKGETLTRDLKRLAARILNIEGFDYCSLNIQIHDARFAVENGLGFGCPHGCCKGGDSADVV